MQHNKYIAFALLSTAAYPIAFDHFKGAFTTTFGGNIAVWTGHFCIRLDTATVSPDEANKKSQLHIQCTTN